MNGADALCDTLLNNGVDVCFANPGTSEMHFVAALDRKPAMRCVLGLSEGVVTGMADGYARMAEKPAVTLLHLGPGLANGLSNIHNAKRANTPMINVVGDHASYHLPLDAPLTSDIESLARPMSHWVRRIANAADVSRAAAEAVAVASTPPGRIATVILPADAAWSEAPEPIATAQHAPAWRPDDARIREAAKALRGDSAARTTILLSGTALRADSLAVAGRIAAATGARLMAQQSNGRVERGAGRVALDRVPFAVDRAVATFADTAQLILIGARAPVAFFAYPGKPGQLWPSTCRVIEMARPGDDLDAALAALADAVGANQTEPVLAPYAPPSLPEGALTADAVNRAIAALLPEQAILCDEAVSSGRDFFAQSAGTAPHDFLQITGGAIGHGLPLATGAAIASPDRKVIAMQADGSGMYTLQALWTQAREQLDVVNVIYSNRRYAILHNELKMVGAGTPGRNASRMLDLVDPAIDWVRVAQGLGVEAARATDAASFNDLLKRGIRERGPFLIEAVI